MEKIKTNNFEEFSFIQSISLKHYKYYTSNIRIHTRKKLLEAYRLKLKITRIDKF